MLLRLFGLEVPHASAFSILSTSGRGGQVCGLCGSVGGRGLWRDNLISEHRSNATELQLHTTDLQQHYLFRAGHDLQREHKYGVMIIKQDKQHRTMSEQYSSEPYRSRPGTGTGTLYLSNILKSLLAARCL